MKVTINNEQHDVRVGTVVRLKNKQQGEVIGEYSNKLIIRTTTGESKPIFSDEIDAILKQVVEKAALSLLDRLWAWIQSKFSK